MKERVGKWGLWLARYILDGLIEDRRFQRLLRHIVLSVACELKHQKDKEILDTFFEYCASVKVVPAIKDGKLVFENPGAIDDHLRKVIILYKRQIKEHVELMDSMEARHQRNGKA